jgi:hypothetical protein
MVEPDHAGVYAMVLDPNTSVYAHHAIIVALMERLVETSVMSRADARAVLERALAILEVRRNEAGSVPRAIDLINKEMFAPFAVK